MPPRVSNAPSSTKRHKTKLPYNFGDTALRHANKCITCQKTIKDHPKLWSDYNELTDYFKEKFPISEDSTPQETAQSLLDLFEYKKKGKYVYPPVIQNVFIPVICDHSKQVGQSFLGAETHQPVEIQNADASSSTIAPIPSSTNTPALSAAQEWFSKMPASEQEDLFLKKWFGDLPLERKKEIFQSADCANCVFQSQVCPHTGNFLDSLNFETMDVDHSPTALDPALQFP